MLSICREIMYVMPVGFGFFLKIYKSHKARTYRVNIKSNDFPIRVRLQPDQPRSAMVTHLVCREIFQGSASPHNWPSFIFPEEGSHSKRLLRFTAPKSGGDYFHYVKYSFSESLLHPLLVLNTYI